MARRSEKTARHYNAPVPNDTDKVVFANNVIPIADQVIEQVEYLWRDGDHVRPAMQLAAVRVNAYSSKR